MKEKFIYLNIIILLLLIIFIPILGLIISIVTYTPSGSGIDEYWINPLLSLFPLSYLITSIYFIFKKKYYNFFFFIAMFFVFAFIFIKIYGTNALIGDYSILLSRIGLIK